MSRAFHEKSQGRRRRGGGLAAPLLAMLAASSALAGCGDGVQKMTTAAESVRSSTERMAYTSIESNNARERKAYEEALEMREAASVRDGLGTGRARYEIRKDGDGWTVYDAVNNRPARVSGKRQSGLSRGEAEASYADLVEEETAAAALFQPSGRSR